MCDDWEAALFERDQIAMVSAGSDTTDTLSDLHALARTALKANAFQQTVDTCQKILDQQPNDWETHYLLGKVFTAIGDHDQACDHFNHAIQAAPHQAGPWLQLASIYKKNDDRLKAVETLSAAIQAVSDDPELYLAYGEALLDQNSPTQALPCFQKAHDLAKALTDPRNPTLRDAGSHLSKVLFDLGHLYKAREIIAPIFNNHPTWVCPKFEEDRAREQVRFGTDIRTWEEDESP